jgi:hypothetical protein
MAHHVETMSSQICTFYNETTINDDATVAVDNAIFCVMDMIVLTVGCCLVTKTAVAMVIVLLFSVSCWHQC